MTILSFLQTNCDTRWKYKRTIFRVNSLLLNKAVSKIKLTIVRNTGKKQFRKVFVREFSLWYEFHLVIRG